MPLLAIIGAGPGLGLSLARRFGREGFTIALVSRDQAGHDVLVALLARDGIVAQGHSADVTEPASLTAALGLIERDLGPIDVLEYSPKPGANAAELAPVASTEMTVADVSPQLQYYLFGGITAIQGVLPQMRRRGSGTILVTTGASSGPVQHPPFGNIAAASGALRNWVLNLHEALRAEGVYVAHIALAAWIGKGGPDSDPDRIADQYWRLYQDRQQPELFWVDATIGQEKSD
ncbi:SDR family NAD(P)-dependent oxidoreductase [Microbacterium sp. SA39]|uniref:SDR family NAD(P)-dependent oxidoreductase n=1 Tax=Microbacterium sp. SA39 TaxID=1263625 RepID=UPI0005FA37CF|nr:SDR family NAD(P)-dependent oxidoreductase [Microbacterium sp. SA39]KJQ52725.1 putative ketoacyl reductase [Microbacterium sp. SA39]